jgi:PIN domain nuclease of toxin-antitoxin system
VKLLLDTHVFLWYLAADPKLPPSFRSTIQDESNNVFVSAATVWEVVVKNAIGKLPLPEPPSKYLSRNRIVHGFASLPIDEETMVHLEALPPVHRDPFDRILLAQAIQHSLTIASVDSEFAGYGVSLLALH